MHAGGLRAPAFATADGRTGGGSLSQQATPAGRSGDGHGKNAGVFNSRNSQRKARGDLDGDEVAAGAALHQGHTLRAEAFRAGVEGGGDERTLEFSVPAENALDG